MLRKCTEKEFQDNLDYFYRLACDLTKSGYPTYCDGIKTKEEFIDRSQKAFDRDNEEILIFEKNGKIRGMIHSYWMAEDNYLGTSGFNIEEGTAEALDEFYELIREEFKGYECFMGFPEDNSQAIDWLRKREFERIEESYNNTAFLDDREFVGPGSDLIKINRDNYESFKVIHDQIEGDMYWNSERILEDLDNWSIWVRLVDEKPAGAIYYVPCDSHWYEIFGVDLGKGEFDQEIFKSLLSVGLYDIRQLGGNVVTFFCEEEGQKAVEEVGFKALGKYLCYKINL